MGARTRKKCYRCGKLAVFKTKKKQLANSLERTYLECGICKHTTTICYTDWRIRHEISRHYVTCQSGDFEAIAEEAERIQKMKDALTLSIEPNR